MPGYSDPSGLPGPEELFAQEPTPDREPGELEAHLRHAMGEADTPPPRRPPDAPDTAALREELGL